MAITKPKKKFTIDDAAKAYKKGTKPAKSPQIIQGGGALRGTYETKTRVPKQGKPMGMTLGGNSSTKYVNKAKASL